MSTGRGRSHPGRLIFLILLISCWAIFIIARLIQLQVVQHREFMQLALQRQQISRAIQGPRGIIYDRHMDELAGSVTVSTVVAEPRRIKDVLGAARALASILKISAQELENRMQDPAHRSFLVVKRRIDPRMEADIESLDVEGVHLIDESMRVYPNRELASHMLGFVNMNGDGGAGLELQYDRELKGTEGQISFDVDALRRSFRGKVEKAPVQGRSLVLSIDRSIQYIAERELKAGVEKSRAAHGIVAVMESDTGRLLALANEPGFNCNAYSEYEADLWRNRAVSDIFEPGSTFKVVVATAALEAGLTRPAEIIDCQMGSITIGRHVFHDHKRYGLLTFNEILEKSSNVGAAKLGLRLGEQRLFEALQTFGFGSKTGVDLPGEIPGLVRDWHDWSALSIGAISFGQEVGVTSLQILSAINAIANGGYRVQPSVVDRIINERGDLAGIRTPQRIRIMKEETAQEVRNAFEGVVLRGTARQAELIGYRAAGKTGTAQKIVDGHYSNTKYMASFIGFAPLPQPKLTILVQIDEPKGIIYGGEVAAPIFRKICQEALMQLKIPLDKSLPMPKLRTVFMAKSSEASRGRTAPETSPAHPPASQASSDQGTVIAVRAGAASVVLPDFRGEAKRKVIDRCLELGIRVHSFGSGFAIYQAPPPGTRVPVGDFCDVTFARGNRSAGSKPDVTPAGFPAAKPVIRTAETRP